MKIEIHNTQKDLKLLKEPVRRVVRAALSFLGMKGDEISIHFVTKEEITALHADYFNDPTLTDCITFPMDTDETTHYRHLGDIFVCPYQALLFAKKRGLDPYEETMLYVVHGLLHLNGFDDLDPKSRKIMKAKEKEVMKMLKSSQAIIS